MQIKKKKSMFGKILEVFFFFYRQVCIQVALNLKMLDL